MPLTNNLDKVSNISEKKSSMQSFVGRLMNHQAELMTWRGELPAHLAPKDIASTESLQAWDQIPWVQRQRCDVELRKTFYSLYHRTCLILPTRVQPHDARNASTVLR